MRRVIVYAILIALIWSLMILLAYARPQFIIENEKSISLADTCGSLPTSQLRQQAVHDAGRFYFPVGCGDFPAHMTWYPDPETCLPLTRARYPIDSDNIAFYAGSLWIGGVVDEDTLVSMGFDGWFGNHDELCPPDPEKGGLIRTGGFADDEFVAVYTDTVTDERYIGLPLPFDPQGHIPLGVEVEQISYSWSDTLYDNFMIVDITITNIRQNLIREGWIGILFDPEIFADTGAGSWVGYRDDASGFLDTLLYDSDPASRAYIAYCFDRDGDPEGDSAWEEYSIRHSISLSMLNTSIADPTVNFNWWLSNGNRLYDFAPRQVGTPEDPFREYYSSGLGTASKQEDKYYLMSHREVDYNHLEMMVHDSSDGWIPATEPFNDYIHDAKLLYSFGPFDLPPGDSISFAIAVVGSDYFHINPDDYIQYYSPEAPYDFQNHLNFSDLMANHRRADSVYRSGYTLPHPGPPADLEIIDFDDDSVALSWDASGHPGVIGYHLNIKDTVYGFNWYHAFPDPTEDTTCVFPVINSTHTHFFAVSVIDSQGRESTPSMPVSVVPAQPHAPCSLTVSLDSLTPVIVWQPPDDAGLVSYMIYRAIWEMPFDIYDSTMQTWYRDEAAESGIKYSYCISASHECGAESAPTDSVSVLPMALDQGILLFDMNNDNSGYMGPHKEEYVDRFFYSIQPVTEVTYIDIEDEDITFKNMAGYSIIIFDCEKRGGNLHIAMLDSIANYLSYGGRGLFLVPNASTLLVGGGAPRAMNFPSGTFYHDILHLDSAVTNSIAIQDNAICGDLTGCRSTAAGYPTLEADSNKLAAATIDIDGSIPMAGCLYPDEEVEVVYRYQSLYPDSLFHEQVNGIAYGDDTYRFVFFNFQLSLMRETDNFLALRKALEFLGADMACGDINGDQRMDIGDAVYLVDYLFREGPPPADERRSDVNCDLDINLADVLEIINVIFRNGPALGCCSQ